MTVNRAAATLKAASIMVEVRTDLLSANMSWFISALVALAASVCVVVTAVRLSSCSCRNTPTKCAIFGSKGYISSFTRDDIKNGTVVANRKGNMRNVLGHRDVGTSLVLR